MKSLVSTCCIVGSFVASAAGQVPERIEVDGPRPLMQLVDRLESWSGIPINYEDPRYSRPDEIEDVADRVLTASKRAANPTARILVPRGGRLAVVLPPTDQTPEQADVGSSLIQMRAAYEAADLPGSFGIVERNGVWHVEGQGVDGTASVMALPVSIPRQTRSAGEFLKLILDQVAQKGGTRVVMGTVPFGAFASVLEEFGADNEPATDAVSRLLVRLSGRTQAGAGLRPVLSYRLLFDPGFQYYVFNVRVVQPIPSAMRQTEPKSVTPVEVDKQRPWPGSRRPE